MSNRSIPVIGNLPTAGRKWQSPVIREDRSKGQRILARVQCKCGFYEGGGGSFIADASYIVKYAALVEIQTIALLDIGKILKLSLTHDQYQKFQNRVNHPKNHWALVYIAEFIMATDI